LGGKNIRKELGDEYAEKIYKAFGDVKDSVDFCCYWFRKAQDCLRIGERVGLVATNSIRQGRSRKAALDYILNHGGYIHTAISTQAWSGDANVHVSIVTWALDKPAICTLDGREVEYINSSLTSTIDTAKASGLRANKGVAFQGVIPVGVDGFTMTPQQAKNLIELNNEYRKIVKPFLTADDLTDAPLSVPSRWIIDFNNMNLEAAERFEHAFAQVRDMVKPIRMKNRRDSTRQNWWKFGEKRPAMRRMIEDSKGYLCFPRHSKWFIPLAIGDNWLPGDSTTVVVKTDSYIHGLITSLPHRLWTSAQKSTLEDRTRYTHTSCFETFPFPQRITPEQAEAIRQQMIELNDYRNSWMVEQQKGITEMYNRYFDEPASKLRKLHDALDALVLKAYGWGPKDDILSNLLDLNFELAEMEEEGRAIVGPWDPNRPPKK